MKVTVSMHVMHWHYRQMEATFYMFFRQSWRNPAITEPKEFTKAEFQVQTQPDTFFVNALEVNFMENGFMAKVAAGGEVLVSRLVEVKVPCLATFDFHGGNGLLANCSLTIESYGHTADQIVYQWKKVDSPVTLATNNVASSLQPVLGTEWLAAEEEMGGKKYSRLTAAFALQLMTEKQLEREMLKMV